jgi:hypothetical protein
VRCACCGHDPNSADAIEQALRADCSRLGIAIFPGGFVSEAGAAQLLGKSPVTMRNRRLTDRPIDVTYAGRSPRYSLRTLGALFVSGSD